MSKMEDREINNKYKYYLLLLKMCINTHIYIYVSINTNHCMYVCMYIDICMFTILMKK